MRKHKAILLCAFVSLCLRVEPALSQIDLSGEWSNITHEDINHRQSVEIGDYAGLPINEAGRFKAESWDEAVLATHERQCIPHPVTYAMRGQPGNIRIGKVDDPDTGQIIAYTIHGTYGRPRTIWMDGRAHPSENAPHTWAGFSTGKWEGDVLTIKTTHLKEGYVRRNGLPRSDAATLTEHWMLRGDVLTVAAIVNDPVYLTEPFIRTTDYELDLHQWVPPYPCQVVEEVERPRGVVPHSLPGTNNAVTDFANRCGLPVEATRGGAETMYPDFRAKIGAITSKCIAAQR